MVYEVRKQSSLDRNGLLKTNAHTMDGCTYFWSEIKQNIKHIIKKTDENSKNAVQLDRNLRCTNLYSIYFAIFWNIFVAISTYQISSKSIFA